MQLKEFGSFKEFPKEKLKGFKKFINESWQKRYFLYDDNKLYEGESSKEQRFLTFDGNNIKARNYVGFINYEGEEIIIYPKVFSNNVKENLEKYLMTNIIYWLRKSSKIKLPVIDININIEEYDTLLEIFISIFSKYTYKLIYNKPYNTYEEIDEETSFLRGRLNVNKYLKENIATGRWNNFNVVHEPFKYDNKLNQIIKYVCNKLSNYVLNNKSKENINKILFILNEVSDIYCTEDHCQQINLNRLQHEYELVLSFCEMFLRNTSISKSENDGKLNFCFLLPMEIIYEDFIFNFMKDNLSDCYKEIKEQKNNLFLAQAIVNDTAPKRMFNLKQDIYLKKKNGEEIIIDTKYKLLNNNPENKYGVSQSDMYQMCSYALIGGYAKLVLLYPMVDNFNKNICFNIDGKLAVSNIKIDIVTVPFVINYEVFIENRDSNSLFEENDKKILNVLSNN